MSITATLSLQMALALSVCRVNDSVSGKIKKFWSVGRFLGLDGVVLRIGVLIVGGYLCEAGYFSYKVP